MNFILNKIRLTLIFVLLIFLIYTFYKSEIHWEGNNRDYYINYQICLIALIIFLIYFFHYLNEKVQKYFFISFLSIILGLYLFEGYLIFKILAKNKVQLVFEGSQTIKQKIYEDKTGKKFGKRNFKKRTHN